MPRHNSVVLVSILVHVGVIAAIILLSILAPDVLPIPRTVLAWDSPRLVQMDIPLPPKPPAPTPRGPVPPPASTTAAPLTAAEGVRPETGNEQLRPEPFEPGIVDGGTSSIALLQTVDAPPPPPPPQRTEPVRLHSGMNAPRKIVDAVPVYPPIAQATRVAGIVIVEVVISETGDVTSAKV